MATYTQTYEKLFAIVAAMMPSLPYHNFGHAMDVHLSALRLATLLQLGKEEHFLLGTAGLLHDAILVSGAKDNEERTAEFARRYLPTLSYNTKQIDTIASLILATKIPTAPKDILQEILCDADLDNLGRDDFFEKNDQVRRELKIEEGASWYSQSLEFLQKHRYYSLAACALRNSGKETNMKKLEKILKKDAA